MRTFRIDRILVPTDLSQPALIALRYARTFAEHFSAGLTIIHVDPITFPVAGMASAEAPLYLADTPERLAELEKEIRTYSEETLAGLAYAVRAVGGQPVPSIVREAEKCAADLIVMATHGLRGWRRAILGSVTESVLHTGDYPVLSVSRPEDRPRTPAGVTKILCPVNFTDVAHDSLDYAAQLAGAFGCELVVVHVLEGQEPIPATALEEDVRRWIEPSMRDRCTYRQIVLRGGPAERVLDCAEDIGADLLVIGAQHKLFRDVTTIGTTTERLVRFARMPVLTVPRGIESVSEIAAAETEPAHAG
ncbi:MAG TPA: universal stress protein [Thermoanaerobaculia bacterium]|nr:universal stress protein [Thermoanaerobaculia bacterium]